MKEPKSYELAIKLPEDLAKFSIIFSVIGDDFEEHFNLRNHLKDPTILQNVAAAIYSAGFQRHAEKGEGDKFSDTRIFDLGVNLGAAAGEALFGGPIKAHQPLQDDEDRKRIWRLLNTALCVATVCDEADAESVADLVGAVKALVAHAAFPDIVAFVNAQVE